MIYIDYNKNTNKSLFNLWYQYYKKINIDFRIFSSDKTPITYYLYNECFIHENIINKNNEIILTEYDFLCTYSVKNTEVDDILELSYNDINMNDITNTSLLIPKLFYVPIKNKTPYTTFEIPDFIIYRHFDHTNYITDGIKVNGGETISDKYVFLNMNISRVAYENEYYENNIFYCDYDKDTKCLDNNIFSNTYARFAGNIITHKELKYAIVWHPKCGCSTICNIFKKINNIDILNPHLISKRIHKYRYNNYLQNIDIITFVRNPYTRFISAYFNKHINRAEKEYLDNIHYKNYLLYINNDDTLYNLSKYIINKNKFIDEHTQPLTDLYYNIYRKNIHFKYTIAKIEEGLEEQLYTFLLKYHNKIDNMDTIRIDNMTTKDDVVEFNNNDYKNYNINDWMEYYSLHNKFPNYNSILIDEELKNLLYKIYSNDFINLGYSQEIINDNDINSKINKLLPEDFNVQSYREYNKDLKKTDIELKIHYIKSGKNENRLYKLNLPDDFDVNLYRQLNKDLKDYSDIGLKLHYIKAGKREGRNYYIDISILPDDFNSESYREINTDLYNYNDLELKLHYIKSGKAEGRNYFIDTSELPIDFNSEIYREFNTDLKDMNDIQLKLHYIKAGKYENRKYSDTYFIKEEFCEINGYSIDTQNIYSHYINDIRMEKNFIFKEYLSHIHINKNTKYILLVNHDNNIYGASHYLYKLFNILKQMYKYKRIKIIICEVKYNNEIYKKYAIDKINTIEYHNDPTLLYMIYKTYVPKIMYINSSNYAIYKISKYIPDHIRLLHSHEIYSHYLLHKEIMPTYVVSNRISSEYFIDYNDYPLIQPPIFDKNDINTIISISDDSIHNIKNNYGTIDKNKITICMCGQISDRKNYKLFIEVSRKYLEYNFLWIGGNEDIFTDYVNIYHIKYTINPYKYFKQVVDYFILFSLIDPCPYVILENIILGTPIIVFDKNIFYEHPENNLYISIKDSINIDTVTYAIITYVKHKKTMIDSNNILYNREYIDSQFVLKNSMIELLNKRLNIRL